MNKGSRIRYFRKFRGLTQKELGFKLGYNASTADVRVTQYEKGVRNPKGHTLDKLADALNVNKQAIDVPEISSKEQLFHLLFALEDEYGLSISNIDFELCLTLDPKNEHYATLHQFFKEWANMKNNQEKNEITKQYYNNWKYNYPESRIKETQRRLNKIKNENNKL